MRFPLLVLTVVTTISYTDDAFAEEADIHVTEAGGLRVVHVWTPATAKGNDALIYMDVENASASQVMLSGGTVLGGPLDLVGFSYGAAGEAWTVLPGLPVPAGGEIRLEPKVLALRWQAVPMNLIAGADLEITVRIGDLALDAHVEIGAADATGHSHAGHAHGKMRLK